MTRQPPGTGDRRRCLIEQRFGHFRHRHYVWPVNLSGHVDRLSGFRCTRIRKLKQTMKKKKKGLMAVIVIVVLVKHELYSTRCKVVPVVSLPTPVFPQVGPSWQHALGRNRVRSAFEFTADYCSNPKIRVKICVTSDPAINFLYF